MSSARPQPREPPGEQAVLLFSMRSRGNVAFDISSSSKFLIGFVILDGFALLKIAGNLIFHMRISTPRKYI